MARIVAAWLQVGDVLGEEKIAALEQQDTEEVAFQRALRFLSYRPRSEAEVGKKLTSAGFAEPVVERVVDRLRSSGLVEDSQFARTWVENRSTFRPRSQRILAMELRQKGVADDDIQKALAETGDEEVLAYQAARQKIRRFEGLDREDFRKRLSAYLGRRGFSYGTVSSVVSRMWSELRSNDGNSLIDGNEENYGEWNV
ncbi:MAG: regulatory protein RecX [Chloroflexi bacterium]|nr:regulatory protein RecX [Chloroflexota bacterium]